VGIRVIVCIQNPFHHFLQTLRPLRMFKIVFRDNSLYRKQLPLFCLLWLIRASADLIGYITNFYSMIELLPELKTAVVKIEEKRKLKVCWASIKNKNQKFTCVLYAHSQFLCSLARFDLANRGVRQPVQPHTCAPLLVFDKTSAQPHFAVVNCSDAVMSVFYSPVTRSLMF